MLTPDDLIAAAHRAGRPAAERTTLYEIRQRYELRPDDSEGARPWRPRMASAGAPGAT
jgi:hypothetical protein